MTTRARLADLAARHGWERAASCYDGISDRYDVWSRPDLGRLRLRFSATGKLTEAAVNGQPIRMDRTRTATAALTSQEGTT